MGSAVDFEDIFAEAEDVRPPVFSKDHYAQASAPGDAQRAHPLSQGTPTSSYLFTLSIATVIFIAVYWFYSFYADLRRRNREAFFQLEHRRRHGIPDDDKRPWHEAYAAVLERRRPLLRRPNAKDTKSTPIYDSAYDPYGRTIKDHFILEENAKVERQNIKELDEAVRLGSPTKDRFYPGPLTIARAKSSVAPDVGAQAGRVSRSPLTRIPSPNKSSISSFANGSYAGNHPQRLAPSNAHSGTHGASKANGRKRLYMDPREDEPEKQQSSGDDDRAAAFSLPKRQRVNTWGTDSQTNGTRIPRLEKRPAEAEGESAASKRQRQTLSTMHRKVALSNGAAHADRLKAKPTVTFAPTPHPSSSASSSVSLQVPNGKLPSGASTAAGSAARGQKREYGGHGDVNDGERHDVSKTDDEPGQPVRKRGREAATGTRQASPKKLAKVPPEIESQMAVDPLCVGHKPGDLWESGNMRFKVGQDGRRLRAGNVKEKRPKYHMPTDSAHHDHSTTIEVVVEKWFTDEEYASAKAAGDFAWQEPSTTPAPKTLPTRAKFGRSSASFWDAPDSPHASPSDSGSEVNPFALGSSGGRLGPIRARSSFGSPAPVPAGGRRATSTRWQKQQAEAEALKRIQEAKIAQEKAKTQPSTPSTPSSAIPPTTAMPSFGPAASLQAKETTATLPVPASNDEKTDKKDSAPKSNPFAGTGAGAFPSASTAAPSTTANPFASFPPSTSATAPTSGSSSAPKLFPPVTSTTPSAPSLFSSTPSAQPKPAPVPPTPFTFPSFAAPKVNGTAAPAANPFVSQPMIQASTAKPDAGIPSASTPAVAPSPFTFGSAAKPTITTSAPAPPSLPALPSGSGFGTFGAGFGGATKSSETSTPAPVPPFVPGKAPSAFSFGPDAKRAESTSTAFSPTTSGEASQLSSATTLVDGAATLAAGVASPFKSLASSSEPAKTNTGPSLLDRLGPQAPATQPTTTPFSSAFSTSSAAPPSVFGTSVPKTSAAPPNPFSKPAVFGGKPEQPSQGISLKGAAGAFGAPAASNGTSNGAAGGFSFNKSWVNPGLANKADNQPSGGSIFGSSASKPNIFQTGPIEPVTTGTGATNAATDAAPKPTSIFGSSVFGNPPSPFGAAPAAAAAGDVPTPDKWVSPTPDSNPFSPQSVVFPAHRPPGTQAGARARSRSSRPLTRPPR